ncbi:hypothetical protein M3Y98_01048500 [Aphelenchoides besseyi]|nr:hypothetical protein M3Y98_01048500 [Aphelenchoides besseyi]
MFRLIVFAVIYKLAKGCYGGGGAFGYNPGVYGPAFTGSYGPYSASRTRAASPSHTFVANSMDGRLQQISECAQRFENQKLSCVQPFDRRSPSSEYDCQQLCEQSQSRCRGYQFDMLTNSCEVFDMDRNSGQRGQLAADEMLDQGLYCTYIKKKDIDAIHPKTHLTTIYEIHYECFRKLKLQALKSYNFRNNDLPGMYCEPSLLSALGTTYVQVDPNCRSSNSALNPTAANTYIGAVEPMPNPDRLPSITKTSTSVNNGPIQMLPPVNPTIFCPDAAPARVQLIDGIEVNQETKPLLGIQLDSPDACLHICQLNAHLDGTPFSRPCRASAFDRSNGRCKIYDSAISPNGPLNYTPLKSSIYFEKFCIPANEIPPGCNDVIHRMPQHTLDRRASGTGAILTASTQIECIRKCLSATVRYSLEIEVFFVFSEPTDLNALLRATSLIGPQKIVIFRVSLASLDLTSTFRRRKNSWITLKWPSVCTTVSFQFTYEIRRYLLAWQRDATPGNEWSQWSECDEKTLTRSRHRNCSECKPRREVIPCISNSAYQHEFPGALLDTESGRKLPVSQIIQEFSETKNISPNFETARRYKNPTKPEQHILPNDQFALRSNIRPIGPPAQQPSKFISLQSTTVIPTTQSSVEESPPFGPPKSGNLPFDLNSMEQRELRFKSTDRHSKIEESEEVDDHDELLRRALEEAKREAAVEAKKESAELVKNKEQSDETTEDGCNPRSHCCPRPGPNKTSARLHGCVMGYRLSSDGKQIACVTDECT